MSETISVLIKNDIAYLTLNRPEKRNALTRDMIQSCLTHLKKIAVNNDARILFLQGNGKDFCAGADIHSMQKMSEASSDENYADAQLLSDLLFYLYHFPKPTVALVSGAVRGGGLGLIAACDIAIAEEYSSFAFTEVKIGITPSVISPYVIAAIGERRAHYYFLTAEIFDAYDAHHAGLIHHVAIQNKLIETRDQLAQKLLANSSRAMKAAKELIRHVAHEKISENLAQHTAEHLSEIRSSKDAKEGLAAFTEKRKPVWSV